MPESRRKGPKLYPEDFAENARKALRTLVEREGGQSAAAKKIDLDQGNVSKLLSRDSGQQIQLATLIELRRELGISLDTMLGLPPIKRPEHNSREELQSRLRALLSLLDSSDVTDALQGDRGKGGKGR